MDNGLQPPSNGSINIFGKQQRLQHKVTALAIALGTLPVLLTGTAAYLFASRSIDQQIIQEKQQHTEIIGDKLDQFLVSRLREVESLATNPLLTDQTLYDAVSDDQRQSILTEFAAAIQYFDSIVLFDPDGNPLVQATEGKPFVGNYGDRTYFQVALKTGQPTMNGPDLSSSSGLLRVEFTVPVKDAATDTILYMIRARVPGCYMNELFDTFRKHGWGWHLFSSEGIIFAGVEQDYMAQPVGDYYSGIMEFVSNKQPVVRVFSNLQENNKKQLVSYAPITVSNSLTSQPIGALITADTSVAFAAQHQLLRIFVLGTGVAAVTVGAITASVANRAIRPIQHLTQVAQRVTQAGDFALKAQVKNQDEIGLLADSLNQLISSVGQYTRELKKSHETLEQRVQERTQQLNAIIDNLGDGLLVINPAGVVIRCNPVLVHMFNLYEKAVIGQPCDQIFDADLAQLIARNQADPTQLLVRDVVLPGEGIGQALVTAVSTNFGMLTSGNVNSIVLIRDITADKEVDQMKTDFISTVSHELRTPLTSVIGFAKLIQKKLEDVVLPVVTVESKKTERAVRQVRENLGIIVSEGERLTSLINDVLDISKIEAGKIDWNVQPTSVADIVDRAISATSVLAQTNNLDLVRQVESELPNVMCDRNRLLQVMINLISNAIKFTTHGSVTCRAHRQDSEVILSVTDTGIGLAPEDIERVFEKFTQVGKVMTDKPSGTGLGLPICKQIIEYHNGRIWADSVPGQGSTFSVALPVKVPPNIKLPDGNLQTLVQKLKENVERTATSADEAQKTILVVDDELHIRQLLRQELEAAGYKVQIAKDGMDALNQIKAAPPDLVVLDMMMPNINGFDLTAMLKSNPATMGIPIIVVSIIQDQERGYRLGVDRYLSKPIDTDLLLQDVKTLLDQGTSNRKVLVVDIDTSTTKTLTEVLLSKGYTVTESTTGQDGIEKVLSLKPDMIIVDSAISMEHDLINTLRFDNGLENIFIVMVDQSSAAPPQPPEPSEK